MKLILLACVLALAPLLALATGRPPTGGPPSNATSSSTSSATSDAASNATSTASPIANAYGGATNSGNAWAVALPGHGSPSYAGNYSICVKGRGFLWNAVWSWDPDPDCIRLIAELDRLARTPVPLPAVFPSIAPTTQPAAAPVACAPPAKAKTVAAAKAAGACKS